MWSREGDVVSTSESVAALGMPLDWRYFLLKLCHDVAVIPPLLVRKVYLLDGNASIFWKCFLTFFSEDESLVKTIVWRLENKTEMSSLLNTELTF